MKHLMVTVAVLLLAGSAIAVPVAGGPAATVDMLLNDIANDSGEVQARARQLLPRFGVEAVPGLIALLGDERETVWRTAAIVLRDIAHQLPPVTMDGTVGDPPRREVCARLMAVVTPQQDPKLLKRALELLPFVTEEATDISPVAALLAHPDARDLARKSLEEAGTAPAIAALVAAAREEADAAFRYALLTSLFNTGASLPDRSFASGMLDDPSPKVRAAAARILAESGEPGHWQSVLDTARGADEGSMFEAWDACLRLADKMARAGGKWETAMAAYRTIAASAPDSVIKSGAIAGLGSFGDDSQIPFLVSLLTDADADRIAAPVLTAFSLMKGRAAGGALLGIWPTLPQDMRGPLLENFGLRRDPIFLPLLTEQAASADPVLRMAALRGLSRCGQEDAAAVLAGALGNASPEEKPELVAMVKRLADDLRDQNAANGAGRAYTALYRATDDPELRADAVNGIRQFPVAEAFDLVLDMAKDEDLATFPVSGMMSIAKAAMDAGRAEDAQKLLDSIMARMSDPNTARQAIDGLRAMPGAGDFSARLGAVREWLVVGPFPWKSADGFSVTFAGEPNVDTAAVYPVGGGQLAWKPVSSGDIAGLVNLAGELGMIDSAAAVAVTEIDSAKDEDITLRAGSDDGLKIWVNGEMVFENDVDRGYATDSDVAPAKLKAGKNRLVVMISQRAGGWAFGLRITRPDGTVPEFTVAVPGK